MHLYFFRHAIAKDADETTPDEKRELTARGVENTKQAAGILKALDIQLDRLYSSPLTRAYQTAALIGEALDIDVLVRKEVGPGFGILAVETLVSELGEDGEAMFVGHEPDMSTTISSLVGGRVVMKKGGLARVDIVMRQPLLGELVWLIAPKVFEAAS
jgi:phosphohistidine phosphatase